MEYGEISEIVVRSGRWDSKDREIGYVVGFRDNGADFRAYVQMPVASTASGTSSEHNNPANHLKAKRLLLAGPIKQLTSESLNFK
jgi:hypothetical protein